MEKQHNVKLEDLSDVLSVSDVQTYLGIGENSAYKMIKSGEIESFNIGRLRKIKKKSLIKYLENAGGQGN